MDDVWRKRILFLETLIFISITTFTPTGSDILYTGDDPVTLLNQNNFETILYGRDNIWFVEFYNSWCGTCIRFAPTWKKLGEDIKGWQSTINMATLDCSVENHVQLCNSHIGNSGYPTLVLFPVNYVHNSGNDQRKLLEGAMEMKELKTAMLSFIESQLSHLKVEVRSSLAPLSSVDDIWNDVTKDTSHTVIVFDSQLSTLGLQVVLDGMQYKDIVVRRVDSKAGSHHQVSVFPSMYLVIRGGTLKQLASGPDQGQYKEALMELVGMETEDKGYEGAGDHPVETEVKSSHKHAGTVVIHMVDLESTLHYSLKQEVAACGDIGGENLITLQNYIYILAKYFPGREPIISYLWSIYNWIKTQSTSMTGSEWLASIEKLQTDSMYIPRQVKWACCEGSSKRYRGYPCGLWTLFHSLTVSSVVHRAKFSDFNPQEVLKAMKGYITHFFGCRECARNFKKEAQDMTDRVLQPKDSVLYLWKVHNSVNERLHGDLTEDPKHLKVPFPTQELCPSCRVAEGNGHFQWDKEEVFSFLSQVYLQNIVMDTGQGSENAANDTAMGRVNDGMMIGARRLNPRDPKIRREFENRQQRLQEENESIEDVSLSHLELKYNLQKDLMRSKFLHIEQEAYNESREEYRSFWNFSSFDISLCVVFYMVCTLIIIAVYFNLMVRKRMSVKRSFRGWLS